MTFLLEEPWYLPDIGPKAKYCLPAGANGTLTIGYGSSGVNAREFVLDDGREEDISFLKLFLSTKPVDYTSVGQKPPFEGMPRICRERLPHILDAWDTIQIPVIQRRHKN